MLDSSDTQRVTFIVLRHMRRPLFVLVTVYAVSMIGWVLIPGSGAEGSPEHMSFFHAFYFLTYTATTTGFGEIPYAFSDMQRMWSIVSLYSGVVAWLYAVGSIIALLQNQHFRQALAQGRFARFVAQIDEPFVIVCGFGNTGSLLTRGLSDAGITAVVLDHEPDRIKALQLRDYRVPMHGLCANARVPARLIDAGMRKRNCRAVVALTGDEEVNLKIAVAARLLNPAVEVITQSTSQAHEDAISTLGRDVHIVDPYQTFSRYLWVTIDNPALFVLNRWLVGDRGANLDEVPRTPRGRWIVCGFGRMGRRINDALEDHGIETVIIEPDYEDDSRARPDVVVARADQAALSEAGAREANGLVACTDDDAYNLGIVLNAKALNPDLFIIVRQELHMNHELYALAGAQLIMQPSLVSARRILFLLVAPLLKPFFERLREARADGDDVFTERVFDELRAHVGSDTVPRLSTLNIDEETTPAVAALLAAGEPVRLEDVMRDPVSRERRLGCVPLVIGNGERLEVMPSPERRLASGDRILLCGDERAFRLLDATVNDAYTLRYLVTGVEPVRGYLMQRLVRR